MHRSEPWFPHLSNGDQMRWVGANKCVLSTCCVHNIALGLRGLTSLPALMGLTVWRRRQTGVQVVTAIRWGSTEETLWEPRRSIYLREGVVKEGFLEEVMSWGLGKGKSAYPIKEGRDEEGEKGRGNSIYKSWKARTKHRWMKVRKRVSEGGGKMRPEGPTGVDVSRGVPTRSGTTESRNLKALDDLNPKRTDTRSSPRPGVPEGKAGAETALGRVGTEGAGA